MRRCGVETFIGRKYLNLEINWSFEYLSTRGIDIHYRSGKDYVDFILGC